MIPHIGDKLLKLLALLKVNRVNMSSETLIIKYLEARYTDIPIDNRTEDRLQDLLDFWDETGPNEIYAARELSNACIKYYDSIGFSNEMQCVDNFLQLVTRLEEHLIISGKRVLQLPTPTDKVAIHAITLFAGVDKIQYGRGH